MAETAMVKQPAWAAAISSSGFVPMPDSNRVANEYGVALSTPLWVVSAPLPFFRSPCHSADAVRFIFDFPFIFSEGHYGRASQRHNSYNSVKAHAPNAPRGTMSRLEPLPYSDAKLRSILQRVKTIAMVGASSNWNRPSYFVMKYLQGKGYRVIPVNPGIAGETLLGEKAYASLRGIPEPVDMVDVFRPARDAPG